MKLLTTAGEMENAYTRMIWMRRDLRPSRANNLLVVESRRGGSGHGLIGIGIGIDRG